MLYLVDLVLLSLFGGIPALECHFRVDLILEGNGIVEALGECRVDVGSGGFDRSVHHKVTFALDRIENIRHDFLIVHFVLPRVNSRVRKNG